MPEFLPELDHFTVDDAWDAGSQLVERCRAARLTVTIGIWLGEQRVFHAALPGTSADNDAWVEKKARVAKRFARSSREVWNHYDVGSNPSFLESFGLSPAEYTPGEGAIPIMVRGSLVGVISVSGLETGGDHEVALSGITGESLPKTLTTAA